MSERMPGQELQPIVEKTLDDFERELNREIERAKELVRRRTEDGEQIPDFDIRGRLYEIALALAPEARRQDLERMHALIQPKQGEISVDIAAGTGFLTKPVTQWTQTKVYAVDPSKEQLDILAQQCSELAQPVLGSPDNPEILNVVPVNAIDFVTSFGGLHHVPDQRTMMENVAKMLKAGGRFVAGDVLKGSKLANHFDTFVTDKCITSHSAQWLDRQRLEELAQDLPLKVVIADEEPTPIQWVFDSKRQMALFFKGLHAYDLPDDEIVNDLGKALGYEEKEDGKVYLNWPMLLFQIDRTQ